MERKGFSRGDILLYLVRTWGHSQKIGDGEYRHNEFSFFFNLVSPIHPLFPLALTQSSRPSFFNNSQPFFFLQFLTDDHLFGNNSIKISIISKKIFVQNVSKVVLCKENLPKFVLFSLFDPFCWSSHLNDPLFLRKISHQMSPSFELLSEHSHHFQS